MERTPDSTDSSGTSGASWATILMGDRMAAGEGSPTPRWMSPAGLETSRERLVSMADAYGGPGAKRASQRLTVLGCGSGELAADLAVARPDADLLAVDVAPRARLATRRRLADAADAHDAFASTTVVGADATRLLAHLEPSDVVYAVNFLQDTDDPVGALRAMASNLRAGGLAVLTVPGEASARRLDDDLFETVAVRVDGAGRELPYLQQQFTFDGETVDWGQYVFPRRVARRLFDDAGFDVLDEDTVPVDARGMVYAAEQLLEDPELAATARELADQQRSNPDAGPTVDAYVLRKRPR